MTEFDWQCKEIADLQFPFQTNSRNVESPIFMHKSGGYAFWHHNNEDIHLKIGTEHIINDIMLFFWETYGSRTVHLNVRVRYYRDNGELKILAAAVDIPAGQRKTQQKG